MLMVNIATRPYVGYLFTFDITTWWLIPLSKWVITPVINGISRVNPLIVGVITCHNPLTKWDEPPSRPCKSREESLPKPYALRL